MSSTTHVQSDGSPDPEIISARVFKAPRESVFRAFTDPDILSRWWGPKGHTNTFYEFDPRPGGAWRFVMHGPDGSSYPMLKRFDEVVPHERISLQHIDATHGFRMVMAFADEAGGTRLTWHMRFDSAAEAERVRELVLEANEQNFDRLERQLSAME
ncbi:MAG TPA: SRPBCC family protein [Symbiobacteriaceae bacterium]|nr:SRPBCC family protein [Symbiobacteriaceae bacterium]